METLDDALLAKISDFIPPTDMLTSTCYVSKGFARVARSDFYWRDHPILRSNDATATLNKHQRQRICLFRDSDVAAKSYGSVFVDYHEAMRMRYSQRRVVCAASTTHNWEEYVENLLSSDVDDDLFYHVFQEGNWVNGQPSCTLMKILWTEN